jgi:uncharacterized protein YbjT (DUF2867 family)
MKCIILGATGLVGQQLLKLALADPRVEQVIAPTRRAIAVHPKLLNPIVDFARLPMDADWWHAELVLCALGTTMRQAGSRQAFFAVDHDYVLQAAQACKKAGTPTWVYNSSLGADAKARSFYLQVKGQIESDLEQIGFSSLGIVRPSFLDGGARPEKRTGEAIAIRIAKWIAPILPQRYRAVSTDKVARMMWQLGFAKTAGLRVIESEQIYQLPETS